VIWRIVIRVVFLAAVGLLLYGISLVDWSEQPKHFKIDDAAIRVEVQPDASLRVTEELEFDFTGDFSGAYRDIPLAEGVKATNVAVIEDGERYRPGGNTTLGSYDRPGTFGAVGIRLPDADGDRPTAGFRVVWHYSARDEERTFLVRYDVTGAAISHDDVVDVPWVVWGDQWDFWLEHLEAEIALAAPATEEPADAWVDPRSLGADPELAPGSASVEIDRVPEGKPTEMRAVFPRSAFRSVAGARVESGAGLGEIQAEEDERDDDVAVHESFAAFVGENIVPIEALWTLLVVAISMALYVAARERPLSVPKYLPEPPEDIPPALAYAVAKEGGYDERLVLATFLDLLDRGYYASKPTEGKELDLYVSIPEDRPDVKSLTEYEETTVAFFDRLLEEGPGQLGKLKDRVPKHSTSWHNRWTKMNDDLDEAEKGQLQWDRNLTGARAGLALLAFTGYVVIGLAYWDRTHLVALPIFALIAGLTLIYLFPSTWLKRLDPESRERHARWRAFERWTDDFPRLDDDPPATLELWRRILVYAVAFGTAERVIASGRIPAPVIEEASSTHLWMYTHFSSADSGVTPSFSGFSSGFSSQVAPQSSSSGGGGGFSGGGGGSSGGGGGGAW
jgi:uncharacterized membrane protein YgcG